MRRLLPLAALAALALPASAQDALAPSDRDGIHVVGAWTLTVTNPDGSVVERREFHNDLRDSRLLVNLLSRQITQGTWLVSLYSGSTNSGDTTGICTDSSNNDAACITVEARGTEFQDSPNIFKNLAIENYYEFNTGIRSFRMTGQITASNEGIIRVVETGASTCDQTIAATACQGGVTGGSSIGVVLFTRRDLGDEALTVAAGQTVNVQVDISFE